MSTTKEPWYFCTDIHRESDEYNWKKLFFPIRKQSEYLKLFEDTDSYTIVGEATPNYINWQEAPKNIYEFNPKAKLLCIIREPLSFIKSSFYQSLKTGHETEINLFKALELEKERRKWKYLPKKIRNPQRLFYTEKINFTRNLQRYLEYFPANQIKVIIYEEFKKDNQKTIDGITDFLWVERIHINKKELNKAKNTRYPKIRNLLQNNFMSNIAIKYFPKNIISILWKILDYVTTTNKKSKELPENEKIKLMQKFKPEVIKINNLLHKNNLIDPKIDLVKYWGYDQV